MLINDEPVAWMEYIQGEEWEVWFVEPTALPKGHTYKPLYTHPLKELTDEEIRAEWYNNCGKDDWFMDFARAILRKAQESCNGFCGEYECKENKAGCKRKAQEK